ncbi:MAG: hydroxypyruvate isomerase [Solirubrobacteraceae bacterium]|nr:hydroxypyruvate isomerase [Solirubrobacteraceae bacterium]
MRFCANVSILFQDAPFLERFARASRAGFRAVEFWWPAGEALDEVAGAIGDAGLSVALFNFDGGDMAAGDRGLAGDPERSGRFRENVPVALELAQRLRCPRLNALVGLEQSRGERESQLRLAAENVRWAADQAAPLGIDVTIEALNTFDNGPCLLHGTPQAAAFLDEVDRPNVRLQYDAYHMQRMEGNLVATITEFATRIGHIQIADSPGRGEPGTGEIAYGFVLRAIEALGYDGWVGLEYAPTTPTTEDSLAWLPADRAGDVAVDRLAL